MTNKIKRFLFYDIEKNILNNISIVSLVLWIIIVILWFCKIIDIKFTITTIWAIFAFWYWYKKYERDKKIEQINSLMTLSENDSYKKTIIKWFTGFKLLNEWYIDNDLFNIIESYWETNFIEHILKSEYFESINSKIAEILGVFNKNEYIINFLIKMKEHWQNNKYKNWDNFIKIVEILEKNNFEK